MGKKKKSKRTAVMQSKRKNKNTNISTNHLADIPQKERSEKNVWKTPVKQACKTRQRLSMEHKDLSRIKDRFVATSFLIEPSKIFDEERRPRTEVVRLLVLVAVLFIGFNLNARWHFPNFMLYVILFSLILAVTYASLSYFYPSMDTLHAEVTGLQPFDKSEYFYIEESTSSIFYAIFPLCFIVTFGVGGSIIYGAISFTPTFIWCLLYFTVVVYFSMLAYSQYIRFAIYIKQPIMNSNLKT